MDTIDKSRVFGIDDYYLNTFDAAATKAFGASFVSHKAGQGTPEIGLGVDPLFKARIQQTRDVGLVDNAYWLFDPRGSVQEQADLFLSQMDGKFGLIPPCIDAETPVANMTDAEYWACAHAGRISLGGFIADVELGIHQECILYSSPGFLTLILSGASAQELAWWALRVRWLAEYKVAQPKPPFSFGWDFWQASEAADGGPLGQVDCNYFNGTAEQFEVLYGTPTPAPAPTPAPVIVQPEMIRLTGDYDDGSSKILYQKGG